MTWEEAEKFVASVLDRMEHESIQEAARRLLDLDATFAEMVAGVNTRDATIAALRAEVERLKEQKAYFAAECVRKGTEILRLSAANADATDELTQLREDRRVLADEVNAWRNACDSHNSPNGMGEAPQDWMCEPTRKMKETNKSGALERANG